MTARRRRRPGVRHRLSREDRRELAGRRAGPRTGPVRPPRLPRSSPLLLRLLGGVLGIGVVVVVLAQLFGGRSGLGSPERPGDSELAAWRRTLEPCVRDAAAELGLRENWIVLFEPGSEGGDSLLTVMEFRVPGDLHEEILNLALTRAVEAAGGGVVRGVELNDARVELDVAWRGNTTHRFVLQRYSRYSRHAGRVALVIDDFGRAPQEVLDACAALGVPWTATVIPDSPGATRQARWFTARNIPVLIHLPMEPEESGEWELGEGALMMSTPPEAVDDLVAAAQAAVPGARGLSNHMGSRVTTDDGLMRALMQSLAARELFFLDSRTTAASVAAREAERAGIPWAGRDVFLDPEDEIRVIEQQFETVLDQARRRGRVIVIGHPRANTLEVLRRRIPGAREEGFEFVTVDRLLDRSGRRP